MPEYQGLRFHTAQPLSKPVGRISKGRKASAPFKMIVNGNDWLHEKSTQVEMNAWTDKLHSKITLGMEQGFGVLVVYQFRHHGANRALHNVFIGAVALTRTNALQQHNIKQKKPLYRPDTPAGWHIGEETYRWFDPKDQPNWNLTNGTEKAEKPQGPKLEAAK